MALQALRGTRDLRGAELKSMISIVNRTRHICDLFGFEDFETPIIESTDVFQRTLGDTSDIVTKEMYTFTDKGGDSITLRPEGTAGIARAVVSNSLLRETPLKLFYTGPMFRHERPQKGRYRQFYQMGAEIIGVESPLADVEVIALGYQVLKNLGLHQQVELQLNTLGDVESRKLYRETLKNYFSNVRASLSEDSQNRIHKNPLRILDSKSEMDQPLIAKAPRFEDYLNAKSKEFFSTVCNHLKTLEIPFALNPQLVRGLDYYTHTVFEFTTKNLGAQNAVLSGGRYDGLIEMMGGPSTPGIGWGAGLDRLALLLNEQPAAKPAIGIIPINESLDAQALLVMKTLHEHGVRAVMPYSGNLSKRFKKLDRWNCVGAIIVSEKSPALVEYKNLKDGTQTELPLQQLLSQLVGHA